MYRALRWVFFRVPPERIHTWVFALLRLATGLGFSRRLLARWLAPTDPALTTTVFGVTFPGPAGLAAGFDKNGSGINAWGPMGFGYAEVGTVTAQAQPGNPAPRLFRLSEDRALLNRMGFNNHGAGELAIKLTRSRSTVPIGVNIGKTKVTPPEHAVDDYAESARLCGPLADFVVVNVSSPNTPGLRDLQAVASLRPILAAVRAETTKPVLVKIAPDLSDDDVDEIADLAVELGLAGIVATNTTISREGLLTPGVVELGAGGVSGAPVAARSLEILRRLHKRVGDKLVLVSAGGIETADDAWERIVAGASLVQGYTGFIYGGGLWAKHIHDGVAAKLKAGGFTSLADAVGSGA
ncbi:quinone-dependent dihydroorotate dehydrogenase [Mycobacterium sp. CBMA293]|uniref:quinone-dependent dihydroorotate dehydrogenase n=1 Tax=unclassified Mycolicibacterium TaxID=2636767 RepID=UPI0012DE812F|nr:MULTISPECIES: quinone-dependent dihydroorotate dehydrogenase [unclassified Mycolicibacterium]MUL49660.1 quinone-dependent dihydroorotate dehydrogenase [Mycolicibacterium sp. CBMA 360]MUL60095.1 quinone-dependent dihydroorotate dehydrogenase [Mycolicibacterium sp. CBMA 335]MUL72882.1 quinone-dependent dihydroorotate dehydrogenase [Mycolicibacterium sp. CBMA 311]MUL96143.1 quinone-dependent dihydroorotate dehydrogenase [Mycolicibacterium sp. CBMA 230]MUM08157.1 dihydroorotate dehydrogenase (q